MTRLCIGAGILRGAGPVLVVSPHLDDAVMSCGRLIAILARQRPVVVVTVFAGRPRTHAVGAWDRDAGFADGDDVIGARRGEDRRALAVLRARPRWLPFADSQYGTSPRVAAVARRLASLLEARADALVLFPLGLFHSDHRLAHDAVLGMLRAGVPRALWLAYEDALYRRLPGLRDTAVARLRRAGLAPRASRVASDAEATRRKTRALSCYRSQLRALATPGRPGHQDACAGESYWRLERPVRCDEALRARPHG